jgi:hypothetical protein
VAEKDRPALAGQYSSMADENESKAFRYGEISDACASRIGLLQAERQNLLRRADQYDGMVVPAPESE